MADWLMQAARRSCFCRFNKGAGTRVFVFRRTTMKSGSYAYQKLSAVVEGFEQNQILYVPENFIERMSAIDVLELQMLDEIEQAQNSLLLDAERLSLMQRTEALKQKLDEANARLFDHLLASIRANDYSTIKQYFKQAEQ